MMKFSIRRPLFALTILLTINSAALAQYVWLDENGHKQYSDQAPPASVPKNKILKFGKESSEDQKSTRPTSSFEEKVQQPESIADKDLNYKKRRDELIAKEKKEADEAKTAATKSDNCKRMQAYKQTLDSGQRINQVDATGAQSYMTDEKRAQELNELRQNLNDCGN